MLYLFLKTAVLLAILGFVVPVISPIPVSAQTTTTPSFPMGTGNCSISFKLPNSSESSNKGSEILYLYKTYISSLPVDGQYPGKVVGNVTVKGNPNNVDFTSVESGYYQIFAPGRTPIWTTLTKAVCPSTPTKTLTPTKIPPTKILTKITPTKAPTPTPTPNPYNAYYACVTDCTTNDSSRFETDEKGVGYCQNKCVKYYPTPTLTPTPTPTPTKKPTPVPTLTRNQCFEKCMDETANLNNCQIRCNIPTPTPTKSPIPTKTVSAKTPIATPTPKPCSSYERYYDCLSAYDKNGYPLCIFDVLDENKCVDNPSKPGYISPTKTSVPSPVPIPTTAPAIKAPIIYPPVSSIEDTYCMASFDWTSQVKNKEVYASGTAPHFTLELYTNARGLKPQKINNYYYRDRDGNRGTGYRYSTDVVIKGDTALPYRLYVCGNRAPGSSIFSGEKCITVSNVYPTCVSIDNKPTEIKSAQEYDNWRRSNIPTPTPTPTLTPTSAPAIQTTDSNCPAISLADADGDNTISLKDFSKRRDCAKKGAITKQQLEDWVRGVWRPAFLNK